jgi:hypothetical protein
MVSSQHGHRARTLAEQGGYSSVSFGARAFESWGVFRACLEHEMVHVRQNRENAFIRSLNQRQNHAVREIEAIDYDIANAARTGPSKGYIDEATKLREGLIKLLPRDVQKEVKKGNYGWKK